MRLDLGNAGIEVARRSADAQRWRGGCTEILQFLGGAVVCLSDFWYNTQHEDSNH